MKRIYVYDDVFFFVSNFCDHILLYVFLGKTIYFLTEGVSDFYRFICEDVRYVPQRN